MQYLRGFGHFASLRPATWLLGGCSVPILAITLKAITTPWSCPCFPLPPGTDSTGLLHGWFSITWNKKLLMVSHIIQNIYHSIKSIHTWYGLPQETPPSRLQSLEMDPVFSSTWMLAFAQSSPVFRKRSMVSDSWSTHSIILLGCVIRHGFLNSGILFSLKLLGGYFKVIGIRVVRIVVCRDM